MNVPNDFMPWYVWKEFVHQSWILFKTCLSWLAFHILLYWQQIHSKKLIVFKEANKSIFIQHTFPHYHNGLIFDCQGTRKCIEKWKEWWCGIIAFKKLHFNSTCNWYFNSFLHFSWCNTMGSVLVTIKIWGLEFEHIARDYREFW